MTMIHLLTQILAALLSLAVAVSSSAHTPVAGPVVVVGAGDIASCYGDDDGAFGVLKLTLHENRYDWTLVSVETHTFTDTGSSGCYERAPLRT
jgi:hypothetical protein